jgi:hypothetical protein
MKTTSVKTRLNRKLNPSRFPHMSGLMAAIIGHILDVTFVNPAIGQIVITSDGFVLARASVVTQNRPLMVTCLLRAYGPRNLMKIVQS